MPGKHALLSASSAGKWLNCPASARLEAELPDTAGEAAVEGTLAHAIAELKLRKYFTPMKPSEFNKALKKLKADPLYQEEMLRHAETYFDYINNIALNCTDTPFVAIEQQVDFSRYAPEGFGTADCILISSDTLWITDFKYGKGVPVYADHNPQMMLYALGTIEAFRFFYDIRRVVMTIVQPRLDNISSFELSRDELLDWGVFTVKPAALSAYEGGGECVPGPWCETHFCRAKSRCRARAEMFLAAAGPATSPEFLSSAEIGDLLTRCRGLPKWYSELETYALEAELGGEDIPGWKAVEGRSVRQFTDQGAAFEALKAAGYNDAMLYDRKPKTLAALEKDLGKAEFSELCGSYILKPPGKPALVPDEDKRQPYNAAEAAFGTTKGENA